MSDAACFARLPDLDPDAPDFVALRRHLHAHPELGADVPETAALVAALLRRWGYEVHEGIGGQGVVGRLRQGTGPRSIGIRADMDALPIAEATGLAYASRVPGAMHACGHDGHTTILLAAAWQLARSRRFDGTLMLIFQPDEEGLTGAKRMVGDGLFDRFPVDAVYALHNGPGIPVGTIVAVEGPTSLASDIATITLTGRGGHGAMPDKARDPVVAAAAIVMALQTVVSRNLPAGETGVVSIGAIHAGTTHNVIPETAELKLNIRSADAGIRERIEARIRAIVAGQAAAFDVTAAIDYRHLVPAVVNTPDETALLRQVAAGIVGETNVLTTLPGIAGSEDFAWMAAGRRACYAVIGNGVGSVGGCMIHNPGYDFNDAALETGISLWVNLVETTLAT